MPIPVSLEDEEWQRHRWPSPRTWCAPFSLHRVRAAGRRGRCPPHPSPYHSDAARGARRPTKVSIAPSWMGVRLELTAELDSATAPPAPRTGQEVIEQARRILELISARALLPVLVFDDTDKWLQVSAPADSIRLVDGFFGRVVRLLAEELPAAAVIAVHDQYVTQPGYRSAGVHRDLGPRPAGTGCDRPCADLGAAGLRPHGPTARGSHLAGGASRTDAALPARTGRETCGGG